MLKIQLLRIISALTVLISSVFIYIPTASATACAPTTTSYGSYTVLSFTTTGTCTWTAPSDITTADILLIGGGGGGGGTAYAGGGGAGGLAEKTNQSISPNTTFTIVVGIGGTGGTAEAPGAGAANNGTSGGDSSITFPDSTLITAKGGGYGAGYDSAGGFAGRAGADGGSGGGSSENKAVSASSTQQTFSGWTTKGNAGGLSPDNGTGRGTGLGTKAGGGGGGAGSVGANANASINTGGAGGSGYANSFRTGTPVTYAAGGDGGSNGVGTVRTAKAANTGNGGDGANFLSTALAGGNGGSGILVIRYIASSGSSSTPSDPQVWLGEYSLTCPEANPGEKERIQYANKVTPVKASSENLVGKYILQQTLDAMGKNGIYFDFWSEKVRTATIELPEYGCNDKLLTLKTNKAIQFIAGGFTLASNARGYLQTPDGTWYDLTGVSLHTNTAAFLHTIQFKNPGKYLIVLSEQPNMDQNIVPTYGLKNARFVVEVKKPSKKVIKETVAKTSSAKTSSTPTTFRTVALVSPYETTNNQISIYLLLPFLLIFLLFMRRKGEAFETTGFGIDPGISRLIEKMYREVRG